MPDIETIQRRLAGMNLRHVSRETGVSYPAVRALAQNGDSPRYDTVKKVWDYLVSQHG